MKEEDFLLIFSFKNYPEWTSAYTMGQYALLKKINGYFNYLDILLNEGLLECKVIGQMSFYKPTQKGKKYVFDKFRNANWDEFELKQTVKELMSGIINKIK